MANKLTSVQTLRMMIQLLGRSHSGRSISKQLQLSRNTVRHYTEQILATGQSLQALQLLDDVQLAALLYPATSPTIADNLRHHNFCQQVFYFLSELKRTGVTRHLLWQEYIALTPDGYRYTQFCFHLQEQKKITAPSFRNTYEPGAMMMVDFAGDMVHYIDKDTGEQIACPVLVCVLPYSNFTYVEALPNARLPHMIAALNNALRFYKGVPLAFKTDNMRQVVVKSSRYEPTFTDLMKQWSLHYNITLDAARIYKPKDKAPVENHVKITYTKVYAPLRDKTFFSLEELNEAIALQLDTLNDKNFQGKTYSRFNQYEQEEQVLLQTLPVHDFELKHSTGAKVQKNYHIVLGEDKHYYSVPFAYIGQYVKAIYDVYTVEIYCKHKRIATHKRSIKRHGYTTAKEHMPQNHQHYTEQKGWDADYFLRQAAAVGTLTATYVQGMLGTRQYTEQTFNACRGILRLAKQYGHQRLEAACERALPSGQYSYKVIENILKNGLDKVIAAAQTNLFQMPEHDNIRGKDAYQ